MAGVVSVIGVDPAGALAELTEISPELEAAVLLDESGSVVASTLADDLRSSQIARAAVELLSTADEIRPRLGEATVTHLQAALAEGSVFLVRAAKRVLAAATAADPTVGLVLYDMKSCLRALDEDDVPS